MNKDAAFSAGDAGTGAIRILRTLLVLSLVLPAALFAAAAWQNWRQLEAEAHASAIKTAAILHEHATKVFDTQELSLDRMEEWVRGKSWDEISRSQEVHAFLKSFPERFEQISSTLLVDPQGYLSNTSRLFPVVPPVAVADRDYFIAPKNGHQGMFIGEPFVARVSGQEIFNVSRVRRDANGGFDGVLCIAVFLDYFQKFYRGVTADGSDSVTLARSDGTVLVREPSISTGTRVLSPASGLMSSIARQPDGGTYETVSELDRVKRFHAFQKVGRYPVYVSFGLNMTRVAQAWHWNLLRYGLLAGFTSLGLASATWFALRQAHTQHQTLGRLRKEISRRERAEADLVQAQKMEAIGQLTGGVAHDFNNLLAVVLGNLDLLRKRLPDDPRIKRLVENAIEGAERGASLTQRMLAFARRQELKPGPVHIPELVRGMHDLMRRSLGGTVRIETRFAPGLPPAHVDGHQLELAILNLAVNARDAMPNGGTLTLSADCHEFAAGTAQLEPGTYIRLAVSDTGEGMDEATLARAAEPFFTTKGIGKGTGLGLSLVHGIAAQSGGRFTIRSQVGEGTTAEIWLPAAQEQDGTGVHPAAMQAADAAPVRKLRVLAVDDDSLVLWNTVAMLEDLGHDVLPAHGAKEGLRILESESNVDLVITDHAMPEMTGLELALELRRRRPGLAVILSSGYAELGEAADPTIPRLQKPYNQDTLAQAIAGVCAKPAS